LPYEIKVYKIGELTFKDLDKKFELHLAFTHECLLAMQVQYGFQAYLEMCLDATTFARWQ